MNDRHERLTLKAGLSLNTKMFCQFMVAIREKGHINNCSGLGSRHKDNLE